MERAPGSSLRRPGRAGQREHQTGPGEAENGLVDRVGRVKLGREPVEEGETRADEGGEQFRQSRSVGRVEGDDVGGQSLVVLRTAPGQYDRDLGLVPQHLQVGDEPAPRG